MERQTLDIAEPAGLSKMLLPSQMQWIAFVQRVHYLDFHAALALAENN
jgi:hypothetical protein